MIPENESREDQIRWYIVHCFFISLKKYIFYFTDENLVHLLRFQTTIYVLLSIL